MKLPDIIAPDLQYCARAHNDQQLLELLYAQPDHLIVFFEYAADDQTWLEQHVTFITTVLNWATDQFFRDNLSLSFAERFVKKMQEHRERLFPYIPNNLTFTIEESSYPVNSLLFGVMSPYVRSLIRTECLYHNDTVLHLKNITAEAFREIEVYVNLGDTPDLWRKTENELVILLSEAARWELPLLVDSCQQILKKYITPKNVVEKLIFAHSHHWHLLSTYAITMINDQHAGIELVDANEDRFFLTFLDFSERALLLFHQLKHLLTHLGYTSDLTQDPQFISTQKECLKLRGISVRSTHAFTDLFYQLSPKLKELDLAKNEWCDDRVFAEIIKVCPDLSKLDLSNNISLSYPSWKALSSLKKLEHLDLSGCNQIQDNDLKMITLACPQLVSLNFTK